jgi:menaquinol-cytochrome c reductase iron-sulfur subunit
MKGPNTPAAEGTTRRQLFGRLSALLAAAIGATLAVPAVSYLIGPGLRRLSAPRASAGTIEELPIDQPVQREIVVETQDGWMKGEQTKGVWVVKRSSGELRVYNPHCTHLGCAYAWNPAAHQFQCPCHGGVYDLDGRVLAGPPPRPLDTMDATTDGDRLIVTYVDFKSGAAKKIPI